MLVSLKYGKIIWINSDTSMLRCAALILIWSGDRPTSPDHEKNPPTTKLDYKFMSDLIDLGFPECINVVFINSDINSNINAEVYSFNPNLEG